MARSSIGNLIFREIAKEGAKIAGSAVREYFKQIGRKAGQVSADKLFAKEPEKPAPQEINLLSQNLITNNNIDFYDHQIISTLVRLGFRKQDVEQAIVSVSPDIYQMKLEEAVKHVLSVIRLPKALEASLNEKE